MSRIIFEKSTQALLGAWIIGSTLVSACSLSVPSESALFGSSGGGSMAAGGTSDEAGMHSGGAPEAGTSAGGTHAAGADGSQAGMADAAGEAGETQGAAGAGGEPGVELPPAVLWLRYDFNDLTQLVAKDSSGNGHDGTLAGLSLPTGSAGHLSGALLLNGAQKQYVQLPNDILDGKDGISVSAWLKLSQALAWDRLFDFNAGESDWFYFSPTGWNDDTKTFGTRCATRSTSALAPEIMMTETISIGVWHHVAVVFAKPFLRYYLDGVLKSEQSNLEFGPSALGKTNQNWIGRSVYAADPYLSGQVDDFRIYSGALSTEQVADLAAE
jgi:hypothetical protein